MSLPRSKKFIETLLLLGPDDFQKIIGECCAGVPGVDAFQGDNGVVRIGDYKYVNISYIGDLWNKLYKLVKDSMKLAQSSPVEDYLEAIDLVDFQIYRMLGESYENHSRKRSRTPLPREIESFIKLNDMKSL